MDPGTISLKMITVRGIEKSVHKVRIFVLEATHYRFPAVAPLGSETHGGDDVAVFARGPYAHLFSGTIEQNVIPHLMSYASCVGEGYTACMDNQNKQKVHNYI